MWIKSTVSPRIYVVTHVSKNCACAILAPAIVSAGVAVWCHDKPEGECCGSGVRRTRGGNSAWDVRRHVFSDWRLTTLWTHDALSRTPCNHCCNRFCSAMGFTTPVGADQRLALRRQWDADSFFRWRPDALYRRKSCKGCCHV